MIIGCPPPSQLCYSHCTVSRHGDREKEETRTTVDDGARWVSRTLQENINIHVATTTDSDRTNWASGADEEQNIVIAHRCGAGDHVGLTLG